MSISRIVLCFLGATAVILGGWNELARIAGLPKLPNLSAISSGPDLHRVAIILGKASSKGITVRESVTTEDIMAIAEMSGDIWLELRINALCGGNSSGLRVRFPRPPELVSGDSALLELSEGIDVDEARKQYNDAVTEHAEAVAEKLEHLEAELPRYLSARDCEDSLVRQGISTLNVIAGEETAQGIYAANHIIVISDGIDAYSGVGCNDQDFPNLERSDLHIVTADYDLKFFAECFNPYVYNDFGSVRDFFVDTFSVEKTEGEEGL